MIAMSRKALIMMALVLVAATAATAATAFAGSTHKFPPVEKQVADAIQSSSDASRRAKLRTVRYVDGFQNGIKLPRPNR
jgi:ABC-type glycerol-3-phosphate transport system substrate-binding protein